MFLLHFDQNQFHILFVECGEPGNPDPYLNFFLNVGFGSLQSECGICNIVADVDFIFHYTGIVQFSSESLALLIKKLFSVENTRYFKGVDTVGPTLQCCGSGSDRTDII